MSTNIFHLYSRLAKEVSRLFTYIGPALKTDFVKKKIEYFAVSLEKEGKE